MKYTFVKQKDIYVEVKIDNDHVTFEKKEETDSPHPKMESWFVDGYVKGKLKYVAVADFEKWNNNFMSLYEIQNY